MTPDCVAGLGDRRRVHRGWTERRPAGRTERLREAEVEHLHGAGGGQLDVGRLQIPMNDAALVRRLERFGDLPRQIGSASSSGMAPLRDPIRQCRAVDELHHERTHGCLTRPVDEDSSNP